jgi:SAM-dependent methyltransferase
MVRPCPLCKKPQPNLFYPGPQRNYLRCQRCSLIFVPMDELLPPKAEKARYDLHENDPANKGYRRFLQQLIQPLIAHVGPPPQHGLDFGCGPGPVLALMLKNRGYTISCYDPYYEPNPQALEQTYDFVTCTEVMEHFYTPAQEWQLLLKLLKPGGWFGLMTQLMDNPEKFPDSDYIKDATHVSLFSRQTFKYLARQDKLEVKFFGDNVILMKKLE